MNAKRQIFWLTVLQGLTVLVGFSVFVGIRQIYQRIAIGGSMDAMTREMVREIVTGEKRETFWATPPGAVLPWLGLPVIFILARNAGSLFYRAGRKKRQIKRNLGAELLLESLQQGNDAPFSLYLRSFSQEDGFKRKKGFWWYVLLEGDVFGIDRETLELLISQRVRMHHPMIALGLPGEKLGAGRLVSTEAEWKDLTLFLMRRATMIFIVPGPSDGVLWEVRHLARDHHAKTRYIMPPAKFLGGDAHRAETLWDEARLPCFSRGIDLPKYDPEGALLMLDANGRVAETLRI
jgi:hypothetical protein